MDATLRVDGLATVLRTVDQIADPEHPNHEKDNRQLGPIAAGTRVFLVAQASRRNAVYWQVDSGGGLSQNGEETPLGWVAEVEGDMPNLEPSQPICPTEFPLEPSTLSALGRFEALACFGDTELTLIGTVICSRPSIDAVVGGASFLEFNRACDLGGEISLHGDAVMSLLELPEPVQSFTGRVLVRGHFDDPGAQVCHSIPFGTSATTPYKPPEPSAVLSCRQMFVVSNVTELD